MFDLGPAAHQLRQLVAAVGDDQLDVPTPCADWPVSGLLAHTFQLATVFTHNARKESVRTDGELPDGWREAIPRQLDDLAEAWRDESAWEGRLSAGGVKMDARDNAVVAMEELVLHGWDLARATGQEVRVEDAWLDQVDRFFEVFAPAFASGKGPYGPAVPAPADASRFELILARAGRDPAWRPSAG